MIQKINPALHRPIRIIVGMTIGATIGLTGNWILPMYWLLFPVIIYINLPKASFQLVWQLTGKSLLLALIASLLTDILANHPFIVWLISTWLCFYAIHDTAKYNNQTPWFFGLISWSLFLILGFSGISTRTLLADYYWSFIITVLLMYPIFFLLPSPGLTPKPPENDISPPLTGNMICIGIILSLALGTYLIFNIKDSVFVFITIIGAVMALKKGDVAKYNQRMIGQLSGCVLVGLLVLMTLGQTDQLLVILLGHLLIVSYLVYAFGQPNNAAALTNAMIGYSVPFILYMTPGQPILYNLSIRIIMLCAAGLAILFIDLTLQG
ncbi:DUF2955 domain-containing protein [Zooshikella harenae]|uniref:DUF2955 domain-containing protein n=1 Tax=Zooshikella harenae TaxID=2827238 RepID=A0ABS5ZHK6_9GAMM|nr:DUF2955 domain-containing protein [Zooshikella harenae]MBU2713557.1 DUF2955 domain-containing protein [Zooshikella harenae]